MKSWVGVAVSPAFGVGLGFGFGFGFGPRFGVTVGDRIVGAAWVDVMLD